MDHRGVAQVPAPGPRAAHTLATLRQKIRAIETRGRIGQRVHLGPGLDPLLAGHGLPLGALHELAAVAYRDQPAVWGFGFGLAGQVLAHRPGPLVVVCARGADAVGSPYGPGLARFGLSPDRLIGITPRNRDQALWALEEAARCPGVGLVMAGLACGLDGVGARRVQLAAEAGGGAVLWLAPWRANPVSIARSRWRIAALAGPAPPILPGQTMPPLGPPAFRLSLDRGGSAPEAPPMDVEWNDATGSFHRLTPVANRAVAPHRRSA